MHADQDDAFETSTKKKLDKAETHTDNVTLKVDKKTEKKSADIDDRKPRIVLTFRSEKSGTRNSNMKIVSTEEKHEEISPRRSNRSRAMKWDSEDDNDPLIPPKKEKIIQSASENDETSDSSITAPKRSLRRSKEYSDNVLANAIARKEKSYNETSTPGPTQRLFRRIKPTAKVLANKELRIGVESQNNARLGITTSEKSSEGGVRTRRSNRRRSIETSTSDNSQTSLGRKNVKRTYENTRQIDDDDEDINSDDENRVKKLKHLCELGLKAIGSDANEEDATVETENRDTETEDNDVEEIEDDDDEEQDDEIEVINQLLEADAYSVVETSDEEFYCSADVSQSERPRRSTRLCSSYGTNENNDNEESSSSVIEIEQKKSKARPRRSPRKMKFRSFAAKDDSNPAGGDEGSEATCPDEETNVIAACLCETPSNVYAAPSELTEPVFCRAIELVDDTRVGCSHSAMKEEDGSYAPMVQAGPRAPYILACTLHTMQLRRHMCCPGCGIFCTQGVFYQCSLGHLFHLECGLPYNDTKLRPGCPHCGVQSYSWQPANRDCCKVKVEMKCSNKRIYLPDQREQCTPAHLGFSASILSQLEQEPILPPSLLPKTPIDLKGLLEHPENTDSEEPSSTSPLQRLRDAILAGEGIEQLLPKILSCRGQLGAGLECEGGGTCMHVAARTGHLAALCALQYADASIDACDAASRTPLMLALLALEDKSQKKTSDNASKEGAEEKKEEEEDMQVDQKDDVESAGKPLEGNKEENKGSEKKGSNERDLLRVIRYLIVANCDVNQSDSEGMTALHIAAQHGSPEAVSLLLTARIDVDARDHGGWTPLVYAAENKHSDVVRLLLEAGADPCAVDQEGNAAIHWCALAGDERALKLMLAADPRAVRALNAHADTPLHVAARQGHYTCVVVLLAHGATTNMENSGGELPVEVSEGECRNAISINMHMKYADADTFARRRPPCPDISNGREAFPIPCVNEVDDTPPPDDFTYVTRHVVPRHLDIDDTLDTMQGCTCKEGQCGVESASGSSTGTGASCACCVLGVRRWYVLGRLAINFPFHEPPMLFECNQTCACDLKKCGNYVVSRLSERGSMLVPAEVYRVGGARGWGLRARRDVPRGAPVALYCGELLSLADADTRARDHYIFALDVKPDLLQQCSDKTELCVDAARFGSAARFINHSCRPNLAPVRVFTALRDLRLPNIALFAMRDISAGDELTFDYGDKFWSVKSKWMKCECGTPNCRYPTKNTEDTE